MRKAKHIILDLGGVILDIDYNRTEEAFIELGIADFGTLYSQLQQTELFDQFETGQINPEAFVAALKTRLPSAITEQQIVNAWNAMLIDLPLRRLQILQQLQLHYDLFLLSNTNALHEEAFHKILKERCGFNSFSVFFDKVYYSHRIGIRKPDAAAFQHILDQNGLNAADTLFVDDSPQHIKGAQQLGIQTIWLQPGMTIEEHIFLPKAQPVS